jgi:hypothetical protein
MDEFVKQITDKWKEMIESTVVSGYSRKVESVDCFRMNKYYTGYPEVEFCYKVTFNFEDVISPSIYSNVTNPYIDDSKKEWHKRLEDRFINMFYDIPERSGPSTGVTGVTEEWWRLNLSRPRKGSNSGETKFENNKVDYMTNQGYRFIIQFYPQGFVSEFRNEKLKELGI